MVDFRKQKDKWNQVLRERKYRPSFFGFPVHVDWYFLLILFVFGLVLILFFTIRGYSDIKILSETNVLDKAETRDINSIDINRFDRILKRIEEN